MKIILIRSNAVNPDSRVEKEVKSLVKAGHDLTVLAWDRDEDYEMKKDVLHFENNLNADIIRLGIKATFGGGMKANLLPLICFQMKMKSYLKTHRNEYDCIHACDFDTAFTAFRVAKKYHKKFTYDIFDYYVDAFGVPGKLKGFIEKQDHAIINQADGVIICSEQRLEQIEGTHPKKLIIVHNTPEKVEVEQEKFHLHKDKLKISYVGVFTPGRFIEETLDYVSQHPEFEYHIGGFGLLQDKVAEYAEKYDNIFYYGRIPYHKTIQLESECDILPAIYDPSIKNHVYAAPNKFYEALMLGKPLIMIQGSGMSQVVEQENIGILTDYSKTGLESALNRMSEFMKNQDQVSLKMKELYDTKYSWAIMEKRLVEYYQNL